MAAWVEVLSAAGIPEDKVNDCYVEAMLGRGRTSYPIVASELCAAWNELNAADYDRSLVAPEKPVDYFEKISAQYQRK